MDNVYGEHELHSVLQAAISGARLDGRAFDEVMPVELTTGIINQASGSVELRMGDIHIYTGVKVLVVSSNLCFSTCVHSSREMLAGGC